MTKLLTAVEMELDMPDTNFERVSLPVGVTTVPVEEGGRAVQESGRAVIIAVAATCVVISEGDPEAVPAADTPLETQPPSPEFAPFT